LPLSFSTKNSNQRDPKGSFGSTKRRGEKGRGGDEEIF